MPNVDPIACLRIEPIVATIGDHDFVVAGHSAADWISTILGGTLHTVMPGWFESRDDSLLLTNMLIDGHIGDEELNAVIMEVMSVASGRASWWALNLIAMIASSNEVWAILHGRLVLAGVRADKVSLGAWIDALYSCTVEGMDKEARQQFDAHMAAPPPGTALDEVEEGDAFMALLGASMNE